MLLLYLFMPPPMASSQFTVNPILFLHPKFTLLLSKAFTNHVPKAANDLNLEGLTLTDEGLTFDLDPAVAETPILEHCLIGRVLTDKQVRFAYFKARLGHFWRPVKRVSITQSGADRFLFQFNHRLDAAKVLEEGPWLYDKYNMVIDRIAPGVVPASVNLNHLDFWVLVHNLPFRLVNHRVANGIGRFLGELKEYDTRNTLHSSYMRLKVRIDVSQPLKKEWQNVLRMAVMLL
jgi:hypothetical protein